MNLSNIQLDLKNVHPQDCGGKWYSFNEVKNNEYKIHKFGKYT